MTKNWFCIELQVLLGKDGKNRKKVAELEAVAMSTWQRNVRGGQGACNPDPPVKKTFC
jgi:hypothetical protein